MANCTSLCTDEDNLIWLPSSVSDDGGFPHAIGWFLVLFIPSTLVVVKLIPQLLRFVVKHAQVLRQRRAM